MKLIDRLERRLHRFAVPNLTLLLIIGQVAIYLVTQAQLMAGQPAPLLEKIVLIPGDVLNGEVWRIFTYVFVPPSVNLVIALIGWYLFFLMGTALERVWGTFRFNLFLFVGFVATTSASFLQPDVAADNRYLFGTVYLAFARYFPEFVLHVFFVLPVKIKWLALIIWVGYAIGFVVGNTIDRVLIAAALANYFLFFGRDHYSRFKDYRRRLEFASKVQSGSRGRIVHTCAVCGLSSADEPRTSFRYCSQCDGQRCYCPEHIRDHEHVVGRSAKE